MARTFTRAELRTRLEQITDTENDSHLSTSEKNAILNAAMADTWDKIISAGLHEKYVKTVSFSSVSGQLEYPIASLPATDFYKIHQLYVDEGSGQRRPLQRINPSEVQTYRPPQSVVPLILYYTPICPVIADGGGGDATTFDGINGWEEHTLMTAACDVMLKKNDSFAQYRERKEELERRMKSMGNIDYSQPPRIARRWKNRNDPWMMFRNNINAYLVRGDKIELYYNYGIIPG